MRLEKVSKLYGANTVAYAIAAAGALKVKRVRLSPRRVRLLASNLLALTAVHGDAPSSEIFLLGLANSLPQPAWGAEVDDATIRAAHEVAWGHAFLEGHEKWLNELLLEPRLEQQVGKILTGCPDPDTGAIGVKRLMAALDPVDAAAFALALYPAALAKVAQPMFEVDAEISWQERRSESGTKHPQLDLCSRVLAKLRGKRKARARQLFYHLVAGGTPVGDPESTEKTFNACIHKVSSALRKTA